MSDCLTCDGMGEVMVEDTYVACDDCDGTGEDRPND